jgi:hypothetical protein
MITEDPRQMEPQILRDHGIGDAQVAGSVKTTALLINGQAAPKPSTAPAPTAAATEPAAANADRAGRPGGAGAVRN